MLAIMAGTALAAAVVAGGIAYAVLARADQQKAQRRRRRHALKTSSAAASSIAKGGQAGVLRGTSGTPTTSGSRPAELEGAADQQCHGEQVGCPAAPQAPFAESARRRAPLQMEEFTLSQSQCLSSRRRGMQRAST